MNFTDTEQVQILIILNRQQEQQNQDIGQVPLEVPLGSTQIHKTPPQPGTCNTAVAQKRA